MHEALSDESGDRALAVAVEHGWTSTSGRHRYGGRCTPPPSATLKSTDAYDQAMAAGRRAGMGGLVARLDSLGYLREGLTADRAKDLVFALFSHETFRALTQDAQWTTEDYKAWLYWTLRGQLAGATDTGRDALRSLSYETHVS